MEYPWIAEAIIDWGIDPCKYKGNEIICDKCALRGEICEKLSELSEIIFSEIKERGKIR